MKSTDTEPGKSSSDFHRKKRNKEQSQLNLEVNVLIQFSIVSINMDNDPINNNIYNCLALSRCSTAIFIYIISFNS